MYGEKLFHSIDFVEDNSNLWLEGEKCPGGSCVVFTYYKQSSLEATTMIKGMGRWIRKCYGEDIVADIFTMFHFKANRGFKYNKQTGLFTTPQERQRSNNLKKDHKISIIQKLKKLQDEENVKQKNKKEVEKSKAETVSEAMKVNLPEDESPKPKKKKKSKKKKGSNSNQSSPTKESHNSDKSATTTPDTHTENNAEDLSTLPSELETIEEKSQEDDESSNVTRKIRDAKLKSLVQKKDPDLDSLENTSQARARPANVNINSNSSVASSLTNFSLQSNSTNQSISSNYSVSSKDSTVQGTNKSPTTNTSNSSKRSKYELTAKMIAQIHNGSEEDLSEDELRRRVLAYQEMKILEAKQIAEAEVAKYIQKKKDTFCNTETTTSPSDPFKTPKSSPQKSVNPPPSYKDVNNNTKNQVNQSIQSEESKNIEEPEEKPPYSDSNTTSTPPPNTTNKQETEPSTPSDINIIPIAQPSASSPPTNPNTTTPKKLSYSQALQTPPNPKQLVSPDPSQKPSKKVPTNTSNPTTKTNKSIEKSETRKSQRLQHKESTSQSKRAGRGNTGKGK